LTIDIRAPANAGLCAAAGGVMLRKYGNAIMLHIGAKRRLKFSSGKQAAILTKSSVKLHERGLPLHQDRGNK
jgi:hypothetical protein